ncbi:hypothetical protein SEPCBS57363_002058 [Sporothrix epigloea]|uniref:2EXR domain-containing protein n=1 Tax=Sporothrix epigloea TaxID=1892477 RepID=A0ABP0DGW8_9PEZI
MQTALFIRQNPPASATGSHAPFVDELLATVYQYGGVVTPTAMASPTTSRSLGVPPRTTFLDLPAEIRNQIWTEALPRRIISVHPQGMKDSSRMPQTLANICCESRAVVKRNGRWIMGAECAPIWFDPKRDIILLNSPFINDCSALARQITLTDPSPRPPTPIQTRSLSADDIILSQGPALPPAGPAPPLSPLKPRVDHHNAPHPYPARTLSILDLDHHQLVGCLDEAVRSGGAIAVHYKMLRSIAGRVIFPLLRTCATIGNLPNFVGARLIVYFDEIAVTGTRAQAVASGLFGSAEVEQMFFVPLSDRETLERILAASKLWPGRSHLKGEFSGTIADGCQSFGGLRVGNAGFIQELLRASHSLNNLRLLAIQYLHHSDLLMFGMEMEPTEHLIARALEASMPPLEQAILFRLKEVIPRVEEHDRMVSFRE